MYLGKRTAALLLMSGEGKRFGSPLPKQFHLLKEKKIYSYALDTLIKSHLFDEILLVTPSSWVEEIQKEVGTSIHVTSGGATRQASAYAGLKALHCPPHIVLIHDAVRPFVSQEILQNNIKKALLHGAVNTCIPSTDTLIFSPDHQTIQKIPQRSNYLRGQTPQTFLYDWILKAHETALQNNIQDATDDCRLVLDLKKPIHIVPGSEKNFKITSEFDLTLAEAFLQEQTSLF